MAEVQRRDEEQRATPRRELSEQRGRVRQSAREAVDQSRNLRHAIGLKQALRRRQRSSDAA